MFLPKLCNETFAGLVADCYTIFGEESSEHEWKKFALSILLQFILLKDTRSVCANSLYCLAISLRIKCMSRIEKITISTLFFYIILHNIRSIHR